MSEMMVAMRCQEGRCRVVFNAIIAKHINPDKVAQPSHFSRLVITFTMKDIDV